MPFEDGHEKLGGRQKGTPNKCTAVIREMLLEAFDKVGGVDYLVKVAYEDPKTFCTLLGKLLPAEIKADLSETKPVKIYVNTGMSNRPPIGIHKVSNFITDDNDKNK